MPLAVILTWVSVGQQLVGAGIATVNTVKTWIKSLHPGLTDEDLNAICAEISRGAIRHRALADADARPPAA